MRETTPQQERVRSICLALPQTQERASHGEPAWFAGGRRQFASYADRHHDDRVAVWVAAPEGAQGLLVAQDPQHYFRPPYVGTRGWVGVYLDVDGVDWERLEQIVEDGWRVVAPARLVARLDAPDGADG